MTSFARALGPSSRSTVRDRVVPILLSLLILLIIPFNFADDNFGSDARSYFSHATTILFNGDLSYSNDLRVEPKHPYGASLWFVAVAYPFSRLDLAHEHPIAHDRSMMGGSWTFFGLLWASPLAFMLGFVLTDRAARNLGLQPRRELLWLLLVGGGVGGIWAHFSYLHSHAVEFLSVSLVIYLSSLAARADAPVAARAAFLLPFAVAFGLMVRSQNIGLFLLPVAVHVLSRAFDPEASAATLSVRRISAPLVGSLIAGWALIAANLRFYGRPYPTILGTYGADMFATAPTVIVDRSAPISEASAPASEAPAAAWEAWGGELIALADRGLGIALWYAERISEVPGFLLTLATTAEFGLLWWTPSLVLGPLTAVIVLLSRATNGGISARQRAIGILAVSAVYAVPLAVVFRWQSFGGGWGYRYLLSTLPLSTLLMFALLNRLAMRQRVAVTAFLVAAALFSVLSQVFFYTTSEFRPEPGAINTFGKSTNNSLPSLGRDVLRASVTPEAWAAAFAGRATGFLGLQLVGEARAVGLLESVGLADSFRYSVDEALAVVGALPDRVRWAYNVTLLAFPLLHYWLMRPPRLADRVRGRFRSCRAARLQSYQGDESTALP